MGLDHSISEIFRMLLGIILACYLIGISILAYQIQTINPFKQQVNYRIERRGGLTNEAMKEINEHSKKYYSGWYTVESEKTGKKLEFGDSIEYKVITNYPVLFLPSNNLKLEIIGQASSQIR